MLKFNQIKTLKIAKTCFYIFSFVTIAIFFSLNVMTFIEPTINTFNHSFTVGAYESNDFLNVGIINNFHLNSSFIIFFSFGIVFFLLTLIVLIFIHLNSLYWFNDQKLTKISWFMILMLLIYFILTTCNIFIKPISLDLTMITNGYKHLNGIYEYSISNLNINFKISSSGIASIFFFSLETFILFLIIIFFSYKIIKKKYI